MPASQKWSSSFKGGGGGGGGGGGYQNRKTKAFTRGEMMMNTWTSGGALVRGARRPLFQQDFLPQTTHCRPPSLMGDYLHQARDYDTSLMGNYSPQARDYDTSLLGDYSLQARDYDTSLLGDYLPQARDYDKRLMGNYSPQARDYDINPMRDYWPHARDYGRSLLGDYMPPSGDYGRSLLGDYMPPSGDFGRSLLGDFREQTTDLIESIRYYSQLDTPESKLALNILTAVLAKSCESEKQHDWNSAPSASDMMYRDVGWGYDDYRRQQNFLSQAGRQVAVRQAGRQVTVRQQIKEKAYGQKGKAKDSKGFVKNQKKEKVEESAVASAAAAAASAAAAATGITDDHKQHKTDEECSPLSHLKNSFKDFQEGTDSSEDIESCEESDGEADSADNADQAQQKNKKHKKINKENQPEGTLSDDVIPKQCLQCHVCILQFNNLQDLKTHLQTDYHKQLGGEFRIKYVATFKLLMAEARLAARRTAAQLENEGRSSVKTKCKQCNCSYRGSYEDHIKLREHYMIANFTRCSICGVHCKSRVDLDNHRYFDDHLMKQILSEQRRLDREREERSLDIEREKQMIEDDKLPEDESLKDFHDAVSALKDAYVTKDLWNASRLPCYDPAVPFGLHFIDKAAEYYCKICPTKLMESFKDAKVHFSSREHYDNYVAYLKACEETEHKQTMHSENLDDEKQVSKSQEGKEQQQEDDSVPEDKECAEVSESISSEDVTDVECLNECLHQLRLS